MTSKFIINCPVCDNKFTDKHEFIEHMKTNHLTTSNDLVDFGIKYQKNYYDIAYEIFIEAIKTNPKNSDAYKALVNLYDACDFTEKHKIIYERLLKHLEESNDSQILFNLGKVYFLHSCRIEHTYNAAYLFEKTLNSNNSTWILKLIDLYNDTKEKSLWSLNNLALKIQNRCPMCGETLVKEQDGIHTYLRCKENIFCGYIKEFSKINILLVKGEIYNTECSSNHIINLVEIQLANHIDLSFYNKTTNKNVNTSPEGIIFSTMFSHESSDHQSISFAVRPLKLRNFYDEEEAKNIIGMIRSYQGPLQNCFIYCPDDETFQVYKYISQKKSSKESKLKFVLGNIYDANAEVIAGGKKLFSKYMTKHRRKTIMANTIEEPDYLKFENAIIKEYKDILKIAEEHKFSSLAIDVYSICMDDKKIEVAAKLVVDILSRYTGPIQYILLYCRSYKVFSVYSSFAEEFNQE